MISFTDYVTECLDHCVAGLITEQEMALKIKQAAWEGMSGVELPTNDLEEIGLSN